MQNVIFVDQIVQNQNGIKATGIVFK